MVVVGPLMEALEAPASEFHILQSLLAGRLPNVDCLETEAAQSIVFATACAF